MSRAPAAQLDPVWEVRLIIDGVTYNAHNYEGYDLVVDVPTITRNICNAEYKAQASTCRIILDYHPEVFLALYTTADWVHLQIDLDGARVFTGVAKYDGSTTLGGTRDQITINGQDYSAFADDELAHDLTITNGVLHTTTPGYTSILGALVGQLDDGWSLASVPALAPVANTQARALGEGNVLPHAVLKQGSRVWDLIADACFYGGHVPYFDEHGTFRVIRWAEAKAIQATVNEYDILRGSLKISKQGRWDDVGSVSMDYKTEHTTALPLKIFEAPTVKIKTLFETQGIEIENLGDATAGGKGLAQARQFEEPQGAGVDGVSQVWKERLYWSIPSGAPIPAGATIAGVQDLTYDWSLTYVVYILGRQKAESFLFKNTDPINYQFGPVCTFSNVDKTGGTVTGQITDFWYSFPGNPNHAVLHTFGVSARVKYYVTKTESLTITQGKATKKKFRSDFVGTLEHTRALLQAYQQLVIGSPGQVEWQEYTERALGQAVTVTDAGRNITLSGLVVGRTYNHKSKKYTYRLLPTQAVDILADEPPATNTDPAPIQGDVAKLLESFDPLGRLAEPISSPALRPGVEPVDSGLYLLYERFGYYDRTTDTWPVEITREGSATFSGTVKATAGNIGEIQLAGGKLTGEGFSLGASGNTIGAFTLATDALQSTDGKLRLDPNANRVEVRTSLGQPVVAMGYLGGLSDPTNRANTLGPNVFGFWSEAGDRIEIQGQLALGNGSSFALDQDASLDINQSDGGLIRFGSHAGDKGLFWYSDPLQEPEGRLLRNYTTGEFQIRDAQAIKLDAPELRVPAAITGTSTWTGGLTLTGSVSVDSLTVTNTLQGKVVLAGDAGPNGSIWVA